MERALDLQKAKARNVDLMRHYSRSEIFVKKKIFDVKANFDFQ